MRVDVQGCKKKVQDIWVETGFKGARQHGKTEVHGKGARDISTQGSGDAKASECSVAVVG